MVIVAAIVVLFVIRTVVRAVTGTITTILVIAAAIWIISLLARGTDDD